MEFRRLPMATSGNAARVDMSTVRRSLTDPLAYDIASIMNYSKPEPGNDHVKASVLIPLMRNGESVDVLLTKRSMRLSSHKGEVCFPGGKADDSDKNETETALREAKEEIGLTSDLCDVITQCPVFISKHGLYVTPVIAFIPSDFTPTLNEDEVETAFTVPLERFLKSEGHHSIVLTFHGNKGLMHHFQCKPADQEETFTVFGLTGLLCLTLAMIVHKQMPEFPLDSIETETTMETMVRKTLKSMSQQSQL